MKVRIYTTNEIDRAGRFVEPVKMTGNASSISVSLHLIALLENEQLHFKKCHILKFLSHLNYYPGLCKPCF